MKKIMTLKVVGIILGIGLCVLPHFSKVEASELEADYRSPLINGQTVSGTLALDEEMAIYPFTTTAPEEAYVTLENVRGHISASIYNAQGEFVAGASEMLDGTLVMKPDVKPGSYTIRIEKSYSETSTNRTAFDLKATFASSEVTYDINKEPNDILKYGFPLQSGVPISSALSSASDTDWFKIQTVNEGMVSVKLTQNDAPVEFDLYDAYGKSIANMEHGDGYKSRYSDEKNWMTGVVKSGTYYIRVSQPDFNKALSKANYTLTSTFDAGPLAHDKNYEPNDIPAYASLLQNGVAVSSTLSDPLDVDWYRFEMKEDGEAYISINQIDGNTGFGIYDDLYYKKTAKGTSDPSSISLQAYLKKGVYYVRVSSYDWEDRRTEGSYTLKATFSNGTLAYDKAMEPNDILENAFLLLSQRAYVAKFEQPADLDWYKVELSKKGMLEVKIGLDTGKAAMKIFDKHGKRLEFKTITNRNFTSKISLNPGTYYIQMYGYGDRFQNSAYKLTMTYPSVQNIPVQLNGSLMAVKPVFMNGVLYYPANSILSFYSAKLTYDSKTNGVRIVKGSVVYTGATSSKVVKVNGTKINLDSEIVKVNEQVFLPNSFLTKVFKSQMTWDNNNQVLLTK